MRKMGGIIIMTTLATLTLGKGSHGTFHSYLVHAGTTTWPSPDDGIDRVLLALPCLIFRKIYTRVLPNFQHNSKQRPRTIASVSSEQYPSTLQL